MSTRDTIRKYNNKNKKTLKSLLPHRCCNKSCAQHWTLKDSKKNTFVHSPGVSEKCEMCGSRLEYYFQGKWRQHSSFEILGGQVQLAQRKKSKRKWTETFTGNFENLIFED
jgi:hypothetical protein